MEGGLYEVYQNYRNGFAPKDINAPECLITNHNTFIPIKITNSTEALYAEVHSTEEDKKKISKKDKYKREEKKKERMKALHAAGYEEAQSTLQVHSTLQAVMTQRENRSFVLGKKEIIAENKTLIR